MKPPLTLSARNGIARMLQRQADQIETLSRSIAEISKESGSRIDAKIAVRLEQLARTTRECQLRIMAVYDEFSAAQVAHARKRGRPLVWKPPAPELLRLYEMVATALEDQLARKGPEELFSRPTIEDHRRVADECEARLKANLAEFNRSPDLRRTGVYEALNRKRKPNRYN